MDISWECAQVLAAKQPNRRVAAALREMARVLEQQQSSPFRINAYRRAAQTVESLEENIQDLLDREGAEGLRALAFIGRGIAAAIEELLLTGSLSQLQRLRGSLQPESLFAGIPGIGPKLAESIHDHLHVDTLEELEIAAHDGRLETVPGIGPRRAQAIRLVLEAQFKRRASSRSRRAPSVAELIDADREYREKAKAGSLRTIVPRRFNPEHKAWLAVLHTQRGDWHMTLLFSNTALAHQLGRTSDWVVVYYYDDDHTEGQCTVVTETRGPREGLRVVRGRELESP